MQSTVSLRCRIVTVASRVSLIAADTLVIGITWLKLARRFKGLKGRKFAYVLLYDGQFPAMICIFCNFIDHLLYTRHCVFCVSRLLCHGRSLHHTHGGDRCICALNILHLTLSRFSVRHLPFNLRP